MGETLKGQNRRKQFKKSRNSVTFANNHRQVYIFEIGPLNAIDLCGFHWTFPFKKIQNGIVSVTF